MKNIERGTIKYLVILILLTAICGMVLYPLFDIVYCKYIVKKAFVYSVYSHIIQPVLFASIFGLTFWSLDKKRK